MIGADKTILVVEDDQNDVFFLQYAFEGAGIENPLQVVTDGQKAIDYLGGKGMYGDRARFPHPGLILLDLKLPVKMGHDVLRWIQSRPEMRHLLTIVLSSSSDTFDIDESYRLGARSYIVKPASLDQRLQMARLFRSFWLELAECPSVAPCAVADRA